MVIFLLRSKPEQVQQILRAIHLQTDGEPRHWGGWGHKERVRMNKEGGLGQNAT